jgi:LPXTG-motif cell wall-anchored protein
VRPCRRSVAACLTALLLAAPGAAWAQGAGDDQYEDPFGDTPAQSGGGGSGSGSGDSGLSPEPQVPGGSQGGSSGSSGSSPGSPGSAGSEGSQGGPDGEAGSAGEDADEAAERRLPNTGSDPRLIAVLGAGLALVGAGLRLRTVDPDLF